MSLMAGAKHMPSLEALGRETSRDLAPISRVLTRPLHVLWACRVASVSAFLGVLMLWKVPQAQDVFLDIAHPWLSGTFGPLPLFVSVILFWAAPLHYSARRILHDKNWAVSPEFYSLPPEKQAERLEEIRRRYGFWIVWIPRFLGILPFVGIGLALNAAGANLPSDISDYLREILPQVRDQIDRLWNLNIAVAGLFFAYMVARRGFVRAAAGSGDARWFRSRTPFATAEDKGPSGQSELGLWLLVLPSLAFAAAFFWPDIISDHLPRASFIALLFGGWIPLLTALSWLSHEWRTPVILLTVVVGSVVTLFLGDSHDVRAPRETFSGDTIAARPPASVRLEDAVAQWRASNPGCEEPGTPCRPVIAAAAGGASRAGFFTVAVLGHLIDATCDGKIEGITEPLGCGAESLLARRLFAISGVSGSSVGAVALAAALHDSPDGAPSCVGDDESTWFRELPRESWRYCGESLLAGDFLSPTMVGFAFRDMFPIKALGSDRAALLERSWERRYARMLGREEGAGNGPASLDRLFTSLAPSGCSGEGEARTCPPWKPILILNGASVETGRFILTTPLDPAYRAPAAFDPAGEDRRVFSNVHHFSELQANRAGGGDAPCTEAGATDISLSTAAHNSARFPLISPPGNVRNACDQIVDRIVDGGYVESFGIVTALQLGRRLAEFNLFPIILLISNDPSAEQDDPLAQLESSCRDGEDRVLVAGPPCPDADDSEIGSWFRAPLGGLLATRSARGRLGAVEAREEAERWAQLYAESLAGEVPLPTDRNFVQIRVFPEPLDGVDSGESVFKDVSMSWWLSHVVQAYLDAQLADDRNVQPLLLLCEGLGGGAARVTSCQDTVDPPRPPAQAMR